MPQNLTQEQMEEKLKKLAADFEFFAHITSHDLRDPLRQARIYSDELLENLTGEDKEKLCSINNLIDLVLNKIALLRDFSYIANGSGKFQEVDLNKLVAEITNSLAAEISSAKANIQIENLPVVNGNQAHLKRLFTALIDNALKFRDKEAKLTIHLSAEEEKDFWHFTISDTGIGLEEVYRELVFVLFQRLDNSEENPSLGAGLAFAKKIVENHGGKIWYKSDGESGTSFHFTIGK